MAGDTPYEAFENFRRPLQRAFSCVDREAHVWALVGTNGYGPSQSHALAPNTGEPVMLSGERRIRLASLFAYRIEKAQGERDPWKARTTAYYHVLEDEDGREILAYHWHPSQGSTQSFFPHLHIGTGIGASLGEVHKYHIPTGRIAVEDVLRLAITEFGVESQRADWKEVLGEAQEAYEAWRTWSGGGPDPAPRAT